MEINQALMDEVTRIKVKVMQSRRDRKFKSIIITSANRREGVSTLAANLAVSLSFGMNTRALLVDGNFRAPVLHDWFDQPRDVGFTEYLRGEAKIDQIIKPTSYENLSLITSGARDPDHLSALTGISRHTKEEIENGFDWVVYDASPANFYPDTMLMTPLSDGVIIMVFAEKTRQAAVQTVIDSLESINANIMGGILNGRQYTVPAFIYKRL